MKISYNFRLGPEAIWLVVNTVVASALLQIVATDFTTITDLGAWALAFGISLLSRTVPAAIIAAATGGFQMPGEPGPAPEPVGPQDDDSLEPPYFPEG